MEQIENFKELLQLKNFSTSTVNGYVATVLNVSKNIGKNYVDVTETDLRKYVLKRNNLSSSSKMAIINSFRAFYRLCLNREFDHSILPRPRVEQKQPDTLSLQEMQQMIDITENVKHKTIICLMYSCGLRVSEVITLKIKDIDSKLMQITIRQSKGKIDRIVMLDDSILQLLRKYASEYNVTKYLFEGAKGDKYSVKSVQHIVKIAAEKIGCKKKISSHSLRHSCFTQMVRNGVDLRTIQKIAGHKNINTTAGYIGLADSEILGTVSPIKGLNL
jgi:site-specific recombinase XerD